MWCSILKGINKELFYMIKLFSAFSGIGAFEKALENLNIDFEITGFSEIDKIKI